MLPAASVAVLPFANATSSSVPDSERFNWIGESLAWTARDVLATKSVIVIERSVIQDAFRDQRLRPFVAFSSASAMKLAETADAEQVVFGSFVFTPSPDSTGAIRATARVLDRRRLRQSPEFVEEGRLEDLPRIELRMAWRVLNFLAPRAAPMESEATSLRAPIRLEAQENFVRGLLAAGPDQEKFFKQAVMLDPSFTHPAFQLGKIYFARKQYKEAAAAFEKTQPLEANYREATFFSGLSRFELADFTGAEKAFRTLVAAVPLGEIWNNVAAAESRRNLPQAVDDFSKALENDPNDPDYHFNLGYALLKKGDFAGAAERFRAVLDRTPGDQMATLLLGRSLKKQPLQFRGADARYQALERMKRNYDERAYWQLKSLLESKEE